MNDSWISGNRYERFMGRWSKPIARRFLAWLAIPPSNSWLDVGCGTGTLTRSMLEMNHPRRIIGIDSSNGFISYARRAIVDPAVHFQVGDAQAMAIASDTVDVTVSGLMLNFVPNPTLAIREMIRVTKPGGKIGIFLWDYAGDMQMLRFFWDAATELDPAARQLDEGARFPLCRQGKLETVTRDAGLRKLEATAFNVLTVFQDFDDYWTPLLGDVGPAPSYVTNLDEQDREELKDKLRESLPVGNDGSVSLVARAWAVKGEASPLPG